MFAWPKNHFIDELSRNDIYAHNLEFCELIGLKSFTEQVKKFVHIYKIDLILCALDDTVIKDELAEFFEEISIPKILMCQDNLSVPFKHKKCCKIFDLVWLTSKETEYLFKKWGAKTCFLPYAANPNIFKPSSLPENIDYDVAFIGSLYGMRKTLIQNLIAAGIQVKVYGKDNSESSPLRNMSNDTIQKIQTALMLARFDIGRRAIFAGILKSLKGLDENSKLDIRLSAQVTFQEIPIVYSRSKLSLGSFELWNTYVLRKPIYKLHLRTFEIPMSGGIQLANNIPELNEYFDHEKEILFYNSYEELLDLTQFYSSEKRDTLRHKMKENARYRSINEHSWYNRFQRLISFL